MSFKKGLIAPGSHNFVEKLKKFVDQWYRYIGLGLLILIYIWSFITARDVFWVGKATFFAMFVLLGIALYDLVIKNGMEKS